MRRKRNVIDYTRSHVATETEAREILEQRRVALEKIAELAVHRVGVQVNDDDVA
jgi:hypothetical protein